MDSVFEPALPSFLSRVIRSPFFVASGVFLVALSFWLSGCAHGPLVHEPTPLPPPSVAPAPDPTPAPTAPTSSPKHEPVSAPSLPSATPTPVAPTPEPVVETIPPDEVRIAVTSEPSGARVLVNNQPVGRTPLRLAVRVTSQGFCADYVTVRARFVAENASQVSQTVDVQLTPLEKPPASLEFTYEGAHRRMK